MKFKINIGDKTLIFNSELRGLKVGNREYVSGEIGKLVYDQTKGINSNKVELQMSTNTSTLIPALRILDIECSKYFDDRDVVESQNNITFYWEPSKLAAYYNRFSTDKLKYSKRRQLIEKAVKFIIKNEKTLPLKEEYLKKVLEKPKLLGFYKGFPIFDSAYGFAKLMSRLGIHIDSETVMVSTPLDKYEDDVFELAEDISKNTKVKYTKKKNRVIFKKKKKILSFLGVVD